MSKKNNNFVVYTALFGDYDDLIDPKEKFGGCDFICFTDQKHLKSDIWEIRHIEECDLPSNMMNRKYKILPHLFLSEYDWSMYIDSNIRIIKNPVELAEKYLNMYNLAIPKHPLRNCIYKEAEGIIERNKGKIMDVLEQIKIYKNHNFPENYGLSENNIIFRKHQSIDVIELMESIWKYFIQTKLKRDQFVFMYIFWKSNYKNYILIDENARNNTYFKILVHKKFKDRNLLQKIFSRLFFMRKKIIDVNVLKILIRLKK